MRKFLNMFEILCKEEEKEEVNNRLSKSQVPIKFNEITNYITMKSCKH